MKGSHERLFWKSSFLLQKQVRHDSSLDQLRDAHGKADLHFTEASRRHSGKMGAAPAASDLHLVSGSAAHTEGKRVLETLYFPEKLPKQHLSWDKLSQPLLEDSIPSAAGKHSATNSICNELTCVSLKLRC